ncbi:MAG TPA: helix-turn-helix transcriptional regulator [Candidatus Saccharimonadales bacterium]|nr:helix-turn-helix transcriptional regulator [Candidatus Saccharimonadales bacterium]
MYSDFRGIVEPRTPIDETDLTNYYEVAPELDEFSAGAFYPDEVPIADQYLPPQEFDDPYAGGAFADYPLELLEEWAITESGSDFDQAAATEFELTLGGVQWRFELRVIGSDAPAPPTQHRGTDLPPPTDRPPRDGSSELPDDEGENRRSWAPGQLQPVISDIVAQLNEAGVDYRRLLNVNQGSLVARALEGGSDITRLAVPTQSQTALVRQLTRIINRLVDQAPDTIALRLPKPEGQIQERGKVKGVGPEMNGIRKWLQRDVPALSEQTGITVTRLYAFFHNNTHLRPDEVHSISDALGLPPDIGDHYAVHVEDRPHRHDGDLRIILANVEQALAEHGVELASLLTGNMRELLPVLKDPAWTNRRIAEEFGISVGGASSMRSNIIAAAEKRAPAGTLPPEALMPPPHKQPEIVNPIARQLAERRGQQEVSIETLADLTGESVSYLQQFFAGTHVPAPGRALSIARALGVTGDEYQEMRTTYWETYRARHRPRWRRPEQPDQSE